MRYQSRMHPTLDILCDSLGRVFVPESGVHKAHWTFGSKDKSTGYMRVRIGGKSFYVHRLAVETFLGEIPKGYEIDHISRVRDDNRLNNLRIVTRSGNRRNCADHDRVTERGGTHRYEDEKQHKREWSSRYYAENREKVLEQEARYRAEHPDKAREWNSRHYQSKRKTQRHVRFSDGSVHWVPNEAAVLLLAIPLNERIFKE